MTRHPTPPTRHRPVHPHADGPDRRATHPAQTRRQVGTRAGDRGSVTVEVALLAPALLALLGLGVAAGRYEHTAAAVEGASAAAARAASLARGPDQAQRDATQVATTTLEGSTPPCRDLTVTVDTTGFRVPASQVIRTGAPAQVAVTVTCAVDLSAITVPGLPGTKTITSRTVSVLDTFRAQPLPAAT